MSNSLDNNRTVINDIDIPMGRLVVIILKVMIASIPALIVFYALFFAIVLLCAVLFGGSAALLNGFGHH